jgi:hypothetical protein
VCVFFDGGCYANKITMGGILENAEKKNQLFNFDYFVSSRRGRMLGANLWNELESRYSLKLEKEFFINEDRNNFIKIYKVSPYEKRKED